MPRSASLFFSSHFTTYKLQLRTKSLTTLCILLLIQSAVCAQKPRARDIGIPFNGVTSKFNAITDVKAVDVGYSTIVSGQGKNIRGKGPVRTGVTAILPRGRNNNPVFANWYSFNGNGEMTGTTWITESGRSNLILNLHNGLLVGRPNHSRYRYI